MRKLTRKTYSLSVKQQVHGRMSINKALRIIGLPRERFDAHPNSLWKRNENRRKAQKAHGHTTFWERNQDCLEEIAQDMKRVFHEHLKQVRHDFTENHDQAALLIGAYTKAKKMFKEHGVDVTFL